MPQSATKRLLERAAGLMGRDELASGLKVSTSQLDAWLNGHADMPERKLRVLAELLAELAGKPSS